MDEYTRANNDFHQRREEVQRYVEMNRGFGEGFTQNISQTFIIQANIKQN
jgi:hypothetical protein